MRFLQESSFLFRLQELLLLLYLFYCCNDMFVEHSSTKNRVCAFPERGDFSVVACCSCFIYLCSCFCCPSSRSAASDKNQRHHRLRKSNVLCTSLCYWSRTIENIVFLLVHGHVNNLPSYIYVNNHTSHTTISGYIFGPFVSNSAQCMLHAREMYCHNSSSSIIVSIYI
jgi:hypothetical protein